MDTHTRVWAADDRCLPHPDGPVNGCRFVARRRDGSPIADGVLVPLDTYHRRAIARGDLATTDPAAPAPQE